MTLDNLKFRVLENGWTVKYHLKESQHPDSESFGGEIFVQDIPGLEAIVINLIRKHMNDPV